MDVLHSIGLFIGARRGDLYPAAEENRAKKIMAGNRRERPELNPA